MYMKNNTSLLFNNFLESRSFFSFFFYERKLGIYLGKEYFFLKRKYFIKVALFLNFLRKKGKKFSPLVFASLLSEPVVTLKSSFIYLIGLVTPFRFFGLNPKKIKKEQASKNAILLLPGNYHNQSAFLCLAKHLKNKGLGPIYTVNLNSGPLTEKDRAILEEKIFEIERQYARYQKKPTIDLVGHSRGAEMAFCMGMERKNWKIDQGVLTIDAGPKSLKIGKVIRLGLSTSPKYRKKVAKEYLESIYEIDAAWDLICKKDEISDQRASHRYLASCGHLGLLYDKNVLKKVINWLTE